MKALARIDKANTDSKEYSSFPNDVMDGAAGRWATKLSQYLETPASFLYMSYLTCLGNIVSFNITLQSTITPQPR